METNKCPKCGVVLSANAPEGLCPRCLMSQGLEEAAQEHKPRRSPAMNNDRNLLFGVLAVQLRKVTPVQLMDIAGGWAMDPSRSLQDRLVEAGVISKEDCEFVNDVVDRAIQSYGGDPSATLNSFGGDEQIYQSFAGSVVRTPDGEISSGRGVKVGDESERLDTVEEMPGRYTHISEYSHGGMGRILLVHDQHLGRDIAMKELLPSPGGAKEDNPQTPVRQAMPMMARFLQEARITGQLEHPAIVPVYELGRRKDGTLYYTMKLVRGETLSKALRTCKSLDDRIKLLPHFLDLCQAMAYAHSLGVIHRDIKPANVMVGQFGETVVIDWGLAKAKGREDIHAKEMEKTMLALRLGKEVDSAHTAYGEAMGTPTYMPPEQAEGKLDIVTERSDVYSLGAVLYEILTGHVPFSGKNVYAILKKVLEEQPASIKSIAPDAPPELIAICKRAMSKDASQRYATAKELAEEIKRFLSGALVQGYRYGLRELLGRFVRRHKAMLATAAAAVILLLVVGVASYVQIIQERDRAIEAGEKEALARQEEVKAREQAEKAKQNLECKYYQSSLLFAQTQIESNTSDMALKTLTQSPEHLRHWEWGYLQSCANEHLWTTLRGHIAFITAIDWFSDGKRILTASADGTARIWDIESGTELSTFFCEAGCYDAIISADEKYVLATSQGGAFDTSDKCKAHIWDTATGNQIATFPVFNGELGSSEFINPSFTVSFSPDSKIIITGCSDNVEKVWDVHSGQELFTLKGHTAPIRCAKYSPDGSRIVTASWDGTVRVWDANTGVELPVKIEGPKNGTQSILFYPDSKKILIRYDGGTVMAKDILDGHTIFTTTLQLTAADLGEISPDGQYFTTGSWDNTANVFDAQTGALIRTLRGHDSSVWMAIFSPDSKRIMTTTGDGKIKLWSVETGQELASIDGHLDRILGAAFSPDGRRIVSGCDDTTVKIWDMSLLPSSIILRHPDEVLWCAFSSDGKNIYTCSNERDNTFKVWDTETCLDSPLFPDKIKSINQCITSSDVSELVTLSKDNKVDIWDFGTQENIASFILEGLPIYGGLLSPDKTRLAVTTGGPGFKLIDARSGKVLAGADGDQPLATSDGFVEFSPDSKRLFVKHFAERLLVTYNAVTGEEMSNVSTEIIHGSCVDYSPDGKNGIVLQWDGAVKVQDLETGAIVHTLIGHTGYIYFASYSPDGKRIVTSSDDRTARVWDAETGDELAVLRGHTGPVLCARFSPDGHKIVTSSYDKTCRIWNTLPWKTEDLPGDDSQSLEVRLQEANRRLRTRSKESVTTSRSISRELLQWTVFQIQQIPEISTGLSDGLDGFVLGDSNTPIPLYKLGLAPQDRIFKVNDHKIDNSKDFIDALADIHDLLNSNQAIPISIIYERQGQRIERSYEIMTTQVERKEISQIRILFQAGFELLETIVPADPNAWVSMNNELAKKNEEPEDAVSLSLNVADEMTQNVLDQFGLAVGDRLCSINGIMMNRVDTLFATLFDLKKKVESGEVNEITIIALRGEFTRVETVITLTD